MKMTRMGVLDAFMSDAVPLELSQLSPPGSVKVFPRWGNDETRTGSLGELSQASPVCNAIISKHVCGQFSHLGCRMLPRTMLKNKATGFVMKRFPSARKTEGARFHY